MKQILNIAVVACVTLLFASCEKEVKLKLPPFTPKLVIYSSPAVGDTITVGLGTSIPTNHTFVSVPYATIKLYADGSFIETLVFDTITGAYRSSTIAAIGKHYKLTASASGYPEVTAEAEAPAIVPIQSLTVAKEARINVNNELEDELKITLTDPPQGGDCYILRVTTYFSGPYGPGQSSYCMYSNDVDFETVSNDIIDENTCLESGNMFFRDVFFNGKTKQLSLYAPSSALQPVFNGMDTTFSQVELLHVSEAYFKHLKSYRFSQENSGNPFSEPINVYTNVVNGYGVFGILSSDVKVLR